MFFCFFIHFLTLFLFSSEIRVAKSYMLRDFRYSTSTFGWKYDFCYFVKKTTMCLDVIERNAHYSIVINNTAVGQFINCEALYLWVKINTISRRIAATPELYGEIAFIKNIQAVVISRNLGD